MKNLALGFILLCAAGCSSSTTDKPTANTDSTHSQVVTDSAQASAPAPSGPGADAATIMGKTQVPVLCYHHIKNIDVLPKNTAGYTVTVNQFKAQLKTLADSGYHTITTDQLYNYLTHGTALPSKPVMLTYDDTDEEQFSIAKPEMDKYHFKGIYFIMTISIGRPNYMTKEQIRQLSDEGHVIASHTWDHSRTDRYIVGDRMIPDGKKQKKFNDWDVQLSKTKVKLEEITGKPVDYFAYPFGVWNSAGIPEIKKRGYKMAFQLATKRDPQEPLYTVRRVLANPYWKEGSLIKALTQSFQTPKPAASNVEVTHQ